LGTNRVRLPRNFLPEESPGSRRPLGNLVFQFVVLFVVIVIVQFVVFRVEFVVVFRVEFVFIVIVKFDILVFVQQRRNGGGIRNRPYR
jgi:hypothetical protein